MSTLNLDQFTNERARAYFYRLLSRGVAPLLTFYGVISEAEAALWVGLLAFVFEVPAHYTSTKRH